MIKKKLKKNDYLIILKKDLNLEIVSYQYNSIQKLLEDLQNLTNSNNNYKILQEFRGKYEKVGIKINLLSNSHIKLSKSSEKRISIKCLDEKNEEIISYISNKQLEESEFSEENLEIEDENNGIQKIMILK